eukprot:TCALIF_12720-PA protein Name:"Protein of unknown function" AED:0.34 eAED:0.70 QI:0/0/0/0.5/0/0/4/0/124
MWTSNVFSKRKEPPAADDIPNHTMDELHIDLSQIGRHFFLAAVDRYSGLPFIYDWNQCPSSHQKFPPLVSIELLILTMPILFDKPPGITITKQDPNPAVSSQISSKAKECKSCTHYRTDEKVEV